MTKWLCLVATLIFSCNLLFADNPTRYQWTPGFIFNGGINISSDKGQLEANQLLDANNFIWRNNQLQVREGFKRYVAPITGLGTTFIDIFGNTKGESYLFYSDGERVWYSQDLTSNPVEIPMGVVNRGTVIRYGNVVRGDSISVQRWRTDLGSGEGIDINVTGTHFTVDRIIDDTLMWLTTDAVDTTASVAYSISKTGLIGINSFQLSDKYWLYSNTARVSFVNPDSVIVEDTISSPRAEYTDVARGCVATLNVPTVQFTVSRSGTDAAAGKFFWFAGTGAATINPVPSGHHYYTTYPILSWDEAKVYTGNTAFPPHATNNGYLSAITLTMDTATQEIITLDSVVSVKLGSLGCASGDTSRYLKLYKSTWTDTAQFITGDWFVSPLRKGGSYGNNFTGGTRSQVHDTIQFVRAYVGTGEAKKIEKAKIQFYSPAPVTGSIKIAIYANDSTFIDTSYTKAVTDYYVTELAFEFANPVNVSDEWVWVAVTSDISTLKMPYKTGANWHTTTMLRTYDGDFPATLTAGSYGVTTNRQTSFKIDFSYYDSTTTPFSTYGNCLPVIGGYLDTANDFIYVGVSNETYPYRDSLPNMAKDPDTTKLMFFRMKKKVTTSTTSGYRFVTVFQDRAFTARDTSCNQIEWSEPFLPDSTISTSVMIINTGDGECITGAMTQFGDLVVYQPNSRWKVFGDGTNAGYGNERMQGSVGCVAKGSLLNIDGNHYFLHSSGYYVSNGDVPVLISANINSYFTDSINTDEYSKVASGYDQENGNIWISFCGVGSVSNNVTLVYNIETQSWWRQSVNASAYYYNPDFVISDSVRFLIGKTDSTTILFRDGIDDDGSDIDAYIQTGYMDFGKPGDSKRLERFHLRHNINYCDSIVYSAYADTMTSIATSVSYAPRRLGWSSRKVGLSDASAVGEMLSSKWMLYNAGVATLPFISLRVWLGDETEGLGNDYVAPNPALEVGEAGGPVQ